MRYTLYSQIKDILKTVIEALEYIKESQNTEMASQLLSDGNDAIEHISQKILENENSIKSREIFNLSSILLERIPTALHKLEYLSSLDDIEFITNATKELLYEIDTNVQYKISVVFFAELGQKWDAMNSLYLAFKNREDCDVSVVLTPILRQVQDGNSVKKDVIYEDYLTDLGIEYIPYERYDISIDSPDMAFISNPYESVTIPQFWPENIAKYTRLVYVPYYTKNNLNSSVFQSESKLPFIHQSWKIIVQSEEVKSAYQKYSLSKKDNFLVAELPKWDALFEVMEQENFSVPEWEKLIGKKVFLWNIHYNIGAPTSTFLKNGKEIIKIFEDRDDIALIFRPHPMMETVFKLYDPKHHTLWKEVKKIILESENMVLDSHSTYKNAFAYSDALLSEYSSIMTEYLFLRKPILWLKQEETDEFLEKLKFIGAIQKLRPSYNIEQVKSFVDQVVKEPAVSREYLNEITKDLPILEGRSGERSVRLLIDLLLNESK